jgi:hypothetical protein
MKFRILIFATLLAIAPPLSAQSLGMTWPVNCRFGESVFDNPFSDTNGYYQPRGAWLVEYSAGSYLAAVLINKITHLPPWLTATVVTVGLGVLPHVRSIGFQHRYRLTADVAFDAVNRATPFVWLAGRTTDTTRSWLSTHWKSAAVWAVADLALCPYASP